MRRFEPRSKHAPMDFKYDSEQRTRGGSPFRMESTRADSQHITPAFGSSSKNGSWTFGAPTSSNTPFSFTSPPSTWIPPANFSPERAFPPQPSPAPEAEMADVSFSTADTETPDASPTLSRQAARGASGTSSKDLTLWTSGSPLRRLTYKMRDRDRSRERERVLERRRGMSRPRWEDAESDEEGQPLVPEQIHFHMPEAKSTHGDLPYILSGYVQFFFNLSLLLVFLYCLVLVLATIRRDVDEKIAEYSANALREIAQCTNTYLTNRCNPETRIPLMEATCRQLEECMNQDPSVVGRARVAAETFAQVANSFVEEISWKTLGFTLISLGFLIAFTNALLFLYRARHAPQLQTATAAPTLPTPPLIAPHFALDGNSWKSGGPLALPETPRRKRTTLSKPS